MNESHKYAVKLLGKDNIGAAEEAGNVNHKKKKIVVFIPEEKSEEMIIALDSAGAGKIGNYSLCSFSSVGTGTFKGNENTKPYLGTSGKFEKVDEVKLEMVFDEEFMNDVIDMMYLHHPYEEPAYEIYDVTVRMGRKKQDGVAVKLKKSLKLSTIIKKTKQNIDIKLIDKKLLNKKISEIIFDRFGNLEEVLQSKLRKKKNSIYINDFSKSSINIKLY